MTAHLSAIFRHPIKGIGVEPLDSATLDPALALRGDRGWALLTAAAPDSDDWQSRGNFLVVANGPSLATITAQSVDGGQLTLQRPDAAALTFDPVAEPDALRDWIAPVWPAHLPAPARLVRAPRHGMTDIPEPWVSVGNLASLRDLSAKAGMDLAPERFRINLWLDGLAPWAEFDLVDTRFQIGTTPLTGKAPIERCRAPEANPVTGARDVAVTRLLHDTWRHADFGIYARVDAPGTVRTGDPVALQ